MSLIPVVFFTKCYCNIFLRLSMTQCCESRSSCYPFTSNWLAHTPIFLSWFYLTIPAHPRRILWRVKVGTRADLVYLLSERLLHSRRTSYVDLCSPPLHPALSFAAAPLFPLKNVPPPAHIGLSGVFFFGAFSTASVASRLFCWRRPGGQSARIWYRWLPNFFFSPLLSKYFFDSASPSPRTP